ncbi:MAG TPA: hypothetical protein VLJ11_11240 [Bryobacteraceae bacterium]|nr:hypothetical protein [Bryobacteraceae bacterium]
MRQLLPLIPLLLTSALAPCIDAHVLTVRVHNVSAADKRDIARLEETATVIFQNARISVVWIECVVSGSHAPAPAACEEQPSPDHVVLVVTNVHARAADHVIGWTNLGTFIANLDYRKAKEMAGASKLHLSCGHILGYSAAHEIGHLLLGSADHGLFGIMKSNYDPRDLLAMSQGRLNFVEDDARRMRARLNCPSPAAR